MGGGEAWSYLRPVDGYLYHKHTVSIVDSERVADAKGDMDGLQNILRHYFVCDDAGVYG
jgi:hypothetical protein